MLDDIEQLASASTLEGAPSTALLSRILAERRAYSFRVEERWADAATWYERAAEFAPPVSREAAKVAGGAVLMRWLAGGSDDEAAEAFGV